VLLLIWNIAVFLKKMLNASLTYQRWRRLEIDSLSEIERTQRHQKTPEPVRKCRALFNTLAYFDMIYFSLSLSSILTWALYIQGAKAVDYSFPIPEGETDLIKRYYNVTQLMANYAGIVAFNTIFLMVKVFDFINQSRHMQMLSGTLLRASEDTMYFLIIFAIFLFGFVGMSFVSFGANLEDFSTVGFAVRKCFETAVGDFDYQSLKKTNEPMAVLFFFPFNILFVFILSNIFLAIINDAYEARRAPEGDEEKDVNYFASAFYCCVKSKYVRKDKKQVKELKSSGQSDLEIFEKLVVNMQQANADLKAWTINCADEIKAELRKRTQLRHENRAILQANFKALNGESVGIVYDEVDAH
jgi:hypothetical protein